MPSRRFSGLCETPPRGGQRCPPILSHTHPVTPKTKTLLSLRGIWGANFKDPHLNPALRLRTRVWGAGLQNGLGPKQAWGWASKTPHHWKSRGEGREKDPLFQHFVFRDAEQESCSHGGWGEWGVVGPFEPLELKSQSPYTFQPVGGPGSWWIQN